jgi:serine protease AprX
MKRSAGCRVYVAGVLAWCMVLAAVPVLAGSQSRQRSKMDPALADAARLGSGDVRVIIRGKAGESRTAIVASSDLEALANDASVDHLSFDAPVRSSARVEDSADARTGRSALVATLGLQGRSLTGRGVGVAVLDSGVQPDSTLKPAAFLDFTNESGAGGAYDDFGHGTHVSGLIAGRHDGVAPGVRLISVKVLNGRGEGLTSTVIRAIDYLIAQRTRLGVDVINLSLGHPITEAAADDPLVHAVERASRAGIVVVVAAGNLGREHDGSITSPGNAPSAITVGALDTAATVARNDDRVATYSSRGPTPFDGILKPDVVAPGSQLVSNGAAGSFLYDTYPEKREVDAAGRVRFRLSGTSMATGVTSGVIALMLEQHRRESTRPLSVNMIKAVLQYAALPLTAVDQVAQGAGALNAAGAIDVVQALEESTDSPEAFRLGSVEPMTTIGDETHVWNQTVVWGNTVIWGYGLFNDTVIWGHTVIWGYGSFNDTVIWGHTVIWGYADTLPE